MAVFYFDYVENGSLLSQDNIGTELEDVNAARVEARQALAEYAKWALRKAETEVKFEIEVRDQDNRPVLKVSLHFQSVLFR